MHTEKYVRTWADHLAFSMVRRDGVYRLYSRKTKPRTLIYETKSLRSVVRWLNKWMSEEIARLEKKPRRRGD